MVLTTRNHLTGIFQSIKSIFCCCCSLMNHWYKPKWSYEICTTELQAFFCLKMSITCISSINRHKWTSQRYRVRFLQSPCGSAAATGGRDRLFKLPSSLALRVPGQAPSRPGRGQPFAFLPPCVRSRHWQLTRGEPAVTLR